jgi:murein DD-endopeptidase MepM/ murein hydrolase activator NlpD
MKNKLILLVMLIFISKSAYSADYKIHYLKEGETLWRISRIYKISINDLCRINNINDVTKVKKGAMIKIPVADKPVKNENKQKKVYYEINMPMEGNIKPYVTSHFRGIIIFSEKDPVNVLVMDEGEVSFTGDVSGYGKTVIIKHDNDTISTYSGFSDINVKKGDKVIKNQNIGNAGNLSRYKKNGILFSVQYKNAGLRFDMEKMKFYRLS